MLVLKRGIIICLLGLFSLSAAAIASPPAPEPKEEKVTPFTVECDKPVEDGFYGVAALNMMVGEESSCSILIDHKIIGLASAAGIKLESNMRKANSITVIVTPDHGVTDGNGRIKFNVSTKKKGSEWVAWALANEKGEFDFSKDAYKKGLACGMFIKIKDK